MKVTSDLLATLSHSEQNAYRLLETPQTRDELIRKLGVPVGEALTLLISLEFKELVKEEFGAWRRT